MSMYMNVSLPKEIALEAGTTSAGKHFFHLSDECLQTLSVDERKAIAPFVGTSSGAFGISLEELRNHKEPETVTLRKEDVDAGLAASKLAQEKRTDVFGHPCAYKVALEALNWASVRPALLAAVAARAAQEREKSLAEEEKKTSKSSTMRTAMRMVDEVVRVSLERIAPELSVQLTEFEDARVFYENVVVEERQNLYPTRAKARNVIASAALNALASGPHIAVSSVMRVTTNTQEKYTAVLVDIQAPEASAVLVYKLEC